MFAFTTRHEVALLASTKLGSSQLLTVDARTAEITQEYHQECSDSPENYNALSHELSVDAAGTRGGYPDLLTTAFEVKKYDGGVVVPIMHRPLNESLDVLKSYAHVLGGTVSAWRRGDNALETVHSLFDYFDPTVDYARSSTFSSDAVWCTDTTTQQETKKVSALDWMHVSSIAVGTQDNYLVSLRALSTVVSLRRDAGGGPAVDWVLSSALENRSDFAFEHASAAFYQPHTVRRRRVAVAVASRLVASRETPLRRPPA